MGGLLQDSSWLALALGSQLVFSVLGQRILNRQLTPEERGMIAFSMLSIGFAYDCLRLGAGSGVTHLVSARARPWAIINTDLCWGLLVAVLTFSAVVWLPNSEHLTGTAISVQFAFLAWLSQAARVPSTFTAALSGLGRYRAVGLSAALGSVTLLLGRAVLVPLFSVKGEFIAYSLSTLVAALPCVLIALREYPLVLPSRGEVGRLWDYARRSAGIQPGIILVERGLPLILLPALGPAAAGVYVAVAVVPSLLGAGVGLITRPLFTRSSTMRAESVNLVFAPACRLLSGASVLGALILVVGAGRVASVLGAQDYPFASSVLAILALQVPARTLSLTIGAHLSGSGHPQFESRALMLGAGTILTCAYLGSRLGGLRGALVGELVGVLVRLVVLAQGLKILRGLGLADVAILRRSDLSLLLNRIRKR